MWRIFRIIVDADSSSVVSRVALRNDDIPIGEQTVAQADVYIIVASPIGKYRKPCYAMAMPC
ncbi:hypothetical protein NQ318_013075 [Aromia moschata]|uniref:Uncharacterized protein n=1 Tax=Aromia moschata TaxID=1265417 RepID=A0AAV8Y0F8_9CUCU|nr:hypothetical protein NQ318_013075 [Aromia moschata]